MGRTAKAAPTLTTLPASADQALAADAAKHGELIAARDRILSVVDSRFGLNRPYDLDTFLRIGRDAVDTLQSQMLVLGCVFISIKEHEPHGSFQSALEHIGVKPRFAQRCMQAVLKFGANDARKALAERLGPAKMLELLVEDDDTLDIVAAGGPIHDIALDDVDRMTPTELRKALRAARKEKDDEIAARDEIIERKDKKINTLETRHRKFAKEPFRVQLDQAMIEVGALVVEYESAGAAVRAALLELDAMHDKAGESYTSETLDIIDGWAKSAMSLAQEIKDLAKA